MSRSRRDHPDMRDDAPGRIPESLIDAAMDGELDPAIQKEIGNALQYDPARRQEFHDTRDAINALRMPIESPDLSDQVLERAHRHRRFIPRKLRQQVRAGRVGMAALLLVTLLGVATLQRMYPRLTTIASQPTPVANIESAIETDGRQLAQTVTGDIQSLRDCMPDPVRGMLAGSLSRPGNTSYNTDVRIVTASLSATAPQSMPHAYPHTSYALVTLAQQHQNDHDRRSAQQRTGGPSNIVLMSWTTSSSNRSSPPDPIDDAIELP